MRETGNDHGRCNRPTVNEIGLVIVDQNFKKRDIVLRSRDEYLREITENHRLFDTLEYHLLFIREKDGYSINLLLCTYATEFDTYKITSASSFYANRLVSRERENNRLLRFRFFLR